MDQLIHYSTDCEDEEWETTRMSLTGTGQINYGSAIHWNTKQIFKKK